MVMSPWPRFFRPTLYVDTVVWYYVVVRARINLFYRHVF